MTMGLKVRSLFDDKEVKKRAKVRKAESDAILESIYDLLVENKGKKISELDIRKRKVN